MELGNTHDLPMGIQEYVESAKQKIEFIAQNLLTKQTANQLNQAQKQANKCKNKEKFKEGDLVYLLSPTSTSLQTASRKLNFNWVGPLILHEKVDQTHCILSDLNGKLLKSTYHINRLKVGFIRSEEGPIKNIKTLRSKSIKNINDRSTVNALQIKENLAYSVIKPDDMCDIPSLDICKTRFKSGKLQMLIKDNNNKTQKHKDFWLDLTETPLEKEHSAYVLLSGQFRVTGRKTRNTNK